MEGIFKGIFYKRIDCNKNSNHCYSGKWKCKLNKLNAIFSYLPQHQYSKNVNWKCNKWSWMVMTKRNYLYSLLDCVFQGIWYCSPFGSVWQYIWRENIWADDIKVSNQESEKEHRHCCIVCKWNFMFQNKSPVHGKNE